MPGAVDESVHLTDYNPDWPSVFAAEHDRLAAALTLHPEQIAHIGSTAVPGLLSKPIVDIMLGVTAYPPAEHFIGAIVRLGYEALGEAGVRGRLYFRRRNAGSFNVHVVELNGEHWRANLALRDYLRANEDARERYRAVKHAAIRSGATQLLAYSQAKGSVLTELISEAAAVKNGVNGRQPL
jgi:GrpB-like predicted nucleotidyltransferase (UPF0157 family)